MRGNFLCTKRLYQSGLDGLHAMIADPSYGLTGSLGDLRKLTEGGVWEEWVEEGERPTNFGISKILRVLL